MEEDRTKAPRKDETSGGLIHDYVAPDRPPDLPYPYLDYDTFSGIKSKYVKSDQKGKWVRQSRSADLQRNVDENKRRQNENRNSFKVDGEKFELVASIPLFVAEMWRKQYGVDVFNKDHEKAVERLLNNPDLKYLKTTTKHI